MNKLFDNNSDIPELSEWLNEISKEARKRGCTDFIVIASHEDHPLGGGSSSYYETKPYKNNPVFLAREALIKWEKKNHLDPDHDWFKESER